MDTLYDYRTCLERNRLLAGISSFAYSDCAVGRRLCGHVFRAGSEHHVCILDIATQSSFVISALLTDTEYRLLEHLARRAGEVCRRQELLERVWGYHFDPGTNVVDVFIRRLRHKLEAAGYPPRIETVRGIGYRLSG